MASKPNKLVILPTLPPCMQTKCYNCTGQQRHIMCLPLKMIIAVVELTVATIEVARTCH